MNTLAQIPSRTFSRALAFVLLLVVSVASGFASTGVYGWGSDWDNSLAIPYSQTEGMVSVTGDYGYGIGLKADGTVLAWGSNSSGETNVPAGLTGVTAISTSNSHTMALKSDGTVVCWGWNGFGQCNVPSGLSGVVAICAGYYHSIALKSDGTVVVWGYNSNGQCNVPSGLSDVKAIAAGYLSCFALKTDGTVVAWGGSYAGETNVPSGLSDVVQLAASGSHAMALRSDGSIVAWGSNSDGESNVPAGLSDVASIAAGLGNSAVVKTDGSVVLWGYNSTGGLNIPRGFTHVSSICLGSYATLVVADDQPLLALDASSIVGGSSYKVKGTVRFLIPSATRRTVALTSTDPSFPVQATVTVPTGALGASFTVSPNLVSPDTPVTVSASALGYTKTADVTIKPITVKSVKLNGSGLYGGKQLSAVVTFSDRPRADLPFATWSSLPNVASVPSTVTLPQGSNFVAFPVDTHPCPATTDVTISLQRGTTPVVSVPLQVVGSPQITSVTLLSGYGLQHLAGKVKVDKAVISDQTVSLTADPALQVPATVTILAGHSDAAFDAVSADVAATTSATVTASNEFSGIGTTVTITPLIPASLTVSAASVNGGASVNVTITLKKAVALDTLVSLAYSAGQISGPATLTIPAGSASANFTATTSTVTAKKSVKITVTKNGTSLTKTVVLTP